MDKSGCRSQTGISKLSIQELQKTIENIQEAFIEFADCVRDSGLVKVVAVRRKSEFEMIEKYRFGQKSKRRKL